MMSYFHKLCDMSSLDKAMEEKWAENWALAHHGKVKVVVTLLRKSWTKDASLADHLGEQIEKVEWEYKNRCSGKINGKINRDK